jgi:hypothetical protein
MTAPTINILKNGKGKGTKIFDRLPKMYSFDEKRKSIVKAKKTK